MNLIDLRDRIRTKAKEACLTYTEFETLFDVNEILEKEMPCLVWKYDGEGNDFALPNTEMTLDFYILGNLFDSEKVETDRLERDWLVTEKDKLRALYINFLKTLPLEKDGNYLEVIRDAQIPIAERLGIEGFLALQMRVTININRSFCLDVED